jgi:hypothetical protein
MAKYTTENGHTFRRKNSYLPCAISAKTDTMSEEEYARVMRANAWADNITNAEWPAVLRHEGVKAYVRSKLKRKAIGWLMAFSRIARLNPPLAIEIMEGVDRLYREQITEHNNDPCIIHWDVLAEQAHEAWLPREGNQPVDEAA